MKFIVVVVMVMSTAHLILANLPVGEEQEQQFQANLQTKQQNPDEKQLSDIDTSRVSSLLKYFKTGSHKKKFKKWKKGAFGKAVKTLGVLNIPGVKLMKYPKYMISELRKRPGHKMTIRNPYRRRYSNPKNQKSQEQDESMLDSKPQKKSLFDLCEEHVDSIIVLAHEDERLAYQVQSVRCEGMCHSTTLQRDLGQCVLKKKTMVVYTIDNSNELVENTIEPGCACECLTTFQ